MSLDGVQLHLVDSLDEAFNLLRWLSEIKGPDIAIDTETTGLSPEADRVRLVQVGDEMHGWAIPFERWGGVFEDIVRRWPGRYDMHNGPFDVAFLDAEGIRLDRSRIDDTKFMAHTLDSVGSVALKNLSSRYVDREAKSMQTGLDAILNQGHYTWATIPIEPDVRSVLAAYWQYAALDTILTKRLKNELHPRVMADAPRSYELELAVCWVIERMERRGCAIDRSYTLDMSRSFMDYVQSLEQWGREQYGLSLGSNAAVIRQLQVDGVVFTKSTPAALVMYGSHEAALATGAIALDRDVLGEIDHPLAQAVLQRRQYQKMDSAFLRQFLAKSERDGRVHPSINSIGGSGKTPGESAGSRGVRTGRMSIADPNMSGLPRTGTSPAGDAVRNAVVASEDGLLVFSDFDQIEMRMLAHLSEDPGLIGSFGGEVDFFTNMGRDIFQEPGFVKSDRRRNIVKSSMYAKAYFSGIDTFAATAHVEHAYAEQFMLEIDRRYPGLKRLQEQILVDAEQTRRAEGQAYIRSPLTNRKLVADHRREYALLNYQIQGLCAEFFKTKLLELDAAGLGDYMILPVHDEVVLDVPQREVPYVVETLRKVMSDYQMFKVPVTAGVSTGQRWGQKTEV